MSNQRHQDLLERSRRHELSPDERRELFEAALHDEELFHSLAVDGLLEESLESPAFRAKFLARRRTRVWAWAAAAAAAAALLAFVLWTRPDAPAPAPVADVRPAPSAPAAPAVTPVLNAAGAAPVLLAAQLMPPPATENPAFRGDTGAAPDPRGTGRVTQVDGEVSIDLGAVDGLHQGLELALQRNGRNTARLRLTTVFLDRARGERITNESVEPGDTAVVPAAVYAGALIAAAHAKDSAGDRAAALRLAEAAVNATPASAPALELLAALEYRSGKADDAHRRFTAAIAAPGASAAAWEGHGCLSLLRGDANAAESSFRRAEELAKDDASRARALNNLGVLAETRGDLAGARALYQKALPLATAGEPPHASIAANLARLQETR